MQSATTIRGKLDSLLNKIGPPLRTVYWRTITVTGGDKLIGRQTSTVADVLLDPQPQFSEQKQAGVTSSGLVVEAGDYHFLISANSMTVAQLINKSTRFVLKDPVSGQPDQVFTIESYKIPSLQGQALLLSVIARSTTS